MRSRLCSLVAVLAATAPVVAQQSAGNTYTWANVNANATSGAAFLAGFTPTVATVGAQPNDGTAFLQFVAAYGPPTAAVGAFAPAAVNPQLTAATAANSALFANTQGFGGYQLAGAGNTLTLGGTGTTGLTTRGTAATRVTDTILAGSAAGSLTLNVGGGSSLTLDGSSTALTNLGTATGGVNLSGMLTLDNTATNVANRLSTTAGVFLTSGTLSVLGNATATTYTVGPLANSATAGVNTIRVTPSAGGGVPTLQFANVPAGSATAFSTRLSTFSVLRFEAGSGVIGIDARITFAGTPGLGANGLLANATTPTSTSGTFGYALAADPGGTDFATWNATNGIVKAGATQTVATLGAITGTDNTSRVQYNPAAGDTAAGNLTVGSFRITPAAASLTAAFGTNNLVTNGLMLDGANDFTLSGTAGTTTGLFGANGTRYIHVNSPAAALTTGLSVVNGTNPTTFAGPGFLILNGTTVQAVGQTGTSNNRFDLSGGTVRGSNANLGFQVAAAGSDSFSAFNFRGGVVEIAGGANGTGTAADFTRSLGTADGQVRWEGGGGGFSAFGSAASVNIGGTAAPTGLTWAATNFVQDGQPLLFGSPRSNAVVTLLNPLALDGGTAGGYAVREVRVAAGAGGDATAFTGGVTGSATTDLLKTGGGTLVLGGTGNTYAGQTLVQQGTLRVGTGGSLPNTRVISVNAGATFDVTLTAAAGFTLASGQTLRGAGTVSGAISVASPLTVGSGAVVAPGQGVGTLTLTSLPTTFQSGSALRVAVASAVPAAGGVNTGGSATAGTGNSLLAAGASSIAFGGGTNLVVDLTGVNLSPTSTYSFTVATGTGITPSGPTAPVTVGSYTFVSGPTDVTASITTQFTPTLVVDNGSAVYLNLVPVPEPATVLTVAAAGLGGLRLVRRRGRGA